jgi:hypothetical protein
MPTRTEAINAFLKAKTHTDLASLYNHDMEVQVNVARDGAEKESGMYEGRSFVTWTDGIERWKSFRIPYNAMNEATYTDKEMSFSLEKHAEGIGMTGWDWKAKKSRWVAYDFDSILGHSDKHNKKLTDAELDKIKAIVESIPWVTVRKSTGGGGLHLYVLLDPITTENHTEHAALARAILHQLSALTSYEFSTKVDVCGGNMWVWHRKMKGTDGLTLIKQGKNLADVPPNWKDHTPVVCGRAPRVHLQEIKELDMFEQLTGQRSKVNLDGEHKALINYLQEGKAYWWWDNNLWMLVTHTAALKAAHEALKMRGKFETLSKGSDGNDHNCFCYPLRRGGWVVRRYTPGTSEAQSWQQDGKGWTRCFLNRDVDVPTACTVAGGIENPSGGFHFNDVHGVKNALKDLNIDLKLLPFMEQTPNRACMIKPGKTESKIVLMIAFDDKDGQHAQENWILDKKKWWTRVCNVSTNQTPDEIESHESYDDIVRHIISEDGEDQGWVIRSGDSWRDEPLVHVKAALVSQGYKPGEINEIVGIQVIQAWKLVNRPFEPEYPGNREWNRKAAQLAVTPSRYSDSLAFPTWQSMFDHCGAGLDEAVKQHEWCQKSNVFTGSDYLKLWVASLLKHPKESLPYLFFWSTEQNTGKTSFHLALSTLFTKGYVRADNALTNTGNFNGELESSILCVLEETDLSRSSQAYNKIKDWVTSPQILLHIKNLTPYMITNSTHWVHCANSYKYCPIFPGDTRITMINVPAFKPKDIIPKKEFLDRIRKEAPDFLSYILKVELPTSNDRLNVPVITTKDKDHASQQNKTELEMFIEEKTYHCLGNAVTFAEFYERFHQYLDAEDRANWSKIKVSRELPIKYPSGRLSSVPDIHIGNIAWEEKAPVGPEYISASDGTRKIVPKKVMS